MLLSETYFKDGEVLSFNSARLDMPKIMRAIDIANSGKEAHLYIDPEQLHNNPNVVRGMHIRGNREMPLSLQKFGDTYRVYPFYNSDYAIAIDGKNKQKFEIANEIHDIISRFNSENPPDFEDKCDYDPFDDIADSIYAEEAENRNVNHVYPAYMR